MWSLQDPREAMPDQCRTIVVYTPSMEAGLARSYSDHGSWAVHGRWANGNDIEITAHDPWPVGWWWTCTPT